MTLRPATDGDRDAVLALGVAEEAAWFGEAELSAEEVGEWIDDEGGVARGVVAVDDDGRVRGFASPGRRETVFLADPALTDALADELLPWLHEQRDVLELMTFAGDAARVAAFERHGLRHRRSSFIWRVPTAPGRCLRRRFPAGSMSRRTASATPTTPSTGSSTSMPRGHPSRDTRSATSTRGGRGCVPAGRCSWLTATSRPVGWVAGRLLESGRGYISMLAVATTERGRGLGRALLLHAFADLQLAGARGLALGVEAHNEAALGLYRSVGLEVEREWRIYATVA